MLVDAAGVRESAAGRGRLHQRALSAPFVDLGSAGVPTARPCRIACGSPKSNDDRRWCSTPLCGAPARHSRPSSRGARPTALARPPAHVVAGVECRRVPCTTCQLSRCFSSPRLPTSQYHSRTCSQWTDKTPRDAYLGAPGAVALSREQEWRRKGSSAERRLPLSGSGPLELSCTEPRSRRSRLSRCRAPRRVAPRAEGREEPGGRGAVWRASCKVWHARHRPRRALLLLLVAPAAAAAACSPARCSPARSPARSLARSHAGCWLVLAGCGLWAVGGAVREVCGCLARRAWARALPARRWRGGGGRTRSAGLWLASEAWPVAGAGRRPARAVRGAARRRVEEEGPKKAAGRAGRRGAGGPRRGRGAAARRRVERAGALGSRPAGCDPRGAARGLKDGRRVGPVRGHRGAGGGRGGAAREQG